MKMRGTCISVLEIWLFQPSPVEMLLAGAMLDNLQDIVPRFQPEVPLPRSLSNGFTNHILLEARNPGILGSCGGRQALPLIIFG